MTKGDDEVTKGRWEGTRLGSYLLHIFPLSCRAVSCPFLSASSHSLPSSSRFVSLRSSPVPTSVTSEEGTGGSETGTGRDQPLHTRPFVSPYVRSSGLMLHG